MSSPLANNTLCTRADLQAAVHAVFEPLRAYWSAGGARVHLGATGAHYPDRGAQLESFARPLWGLVPLAAGGGIFEGWSFYHQGLTNGSDPAHPEYWGIVAHLDQRLVEMGAIGFALALVPEHVWEPLDPRARENLTRWLGQINQVEVVDNNWLFFRVLANLGLARVGATHDPAMLTTALERLDTFYLGAGWYADGPTMQRDYYVAFAMHFYGLIYTQLADLHAGDRAQRWRERAALFAHDFMHWFAPDGAALPFGRSLTYRFAQGAFWGALAFAGVEALPWGVVKGLLLRHLRWWARQPIFNADGTLSIGYAYPNLNMAENYNAPGSPYWALKAFLPLALPASHPFWQAEEAPLPALPPVHAQPHAGMVIGRDQPARHVFALSSGQHALWLRHGADKYSKFAYSTAFGFSVPSGGHGLEQGAHDNMLALSDDGIHFRVREALVEATLDAEMLYSHWKPWPDVDVETWLMLALPWHIRIHRLRTKRHLQSAEGGWALDRTGDDPVDPLGTTDYGPGRAVAIFPAGWSGLRDVGGARVGQVVRLDPNTNLLAPRTVLPTLRGQHIAGEHWLVCAVIGVPGTHAWQDVWDRPPAVVRPENPVLARLLCGGVLPSALRP